MSITLKKPDITELKPRITVFGVGGGGCNAVNNMISAGLEGVDFVIANTDAQALRSSRAERIIQMGVAVTEGLGAGSQPEVGRAAAEESIDEICDHLLGSHMCFVTAGMGGGTGTGAAPVVARAAREKGILTVGVVTKPFHFEGQRRLRIAEQGIEELQKNVDTLIVIPNQNLFRIANDKTTFADAFAMADQVLYSGVACITDLMVKEGLINLDFADVRSVMREMGKAMMGTGEASGEGRAMAAAEAAIANPLLDETSMKGAKGLLISITGGRDLTLFEVDEAATRIREEVDQDANIILGATFDENLEGVIRVSVVATGIDKSEVEMAARPTMTASQTAFVSQQRVSAQAAQAPQPAVQQAPAASAHAAPAQPAEEEPEIEDAFSAALAAEIAHVAPQPAARPTVPTAETAAEPVASPRMPRVEDFPPVVRGEMEQRSAANEPAPDERGAMGLLRRLTTGLSRREDEEHQAAEPARRAHVEPNPYAPRRVASESAARPATASRPVSEEDQLEIPAFLRRQAN
ncbi:cell division protein FtsZ [Jiella pacifica]|uniref:Cell division protein FtsZ n=1 Tax=Jiella pacifica TaxID=2696469 RepID=A0A6N9T026_9HYPH|nr:cell division protein FtsZ [Jiella pacifica]NDW03299.1 cell division protein FtsZ [Jiella pacifica]